MTVRQWARIHDNPPNEETCANAARGGHLKVMQWARSYRYPWNMQTCANAAETGHLDVLKWARVQGCPWMSVHVPELWPKAVI